jgi:pimeloyl-ACP methyl ester carboxylesterase
MSQMTTRRADIITGSVMTEGDELYYEIRGEGPPLLMIPGGGGDGKIYSFVADILADEYKVITYDRRGNARSTRNDPQNFEVSQQSRDAVAVIQAAGETSAIVFGCSSGAVIALDMAKTQPQAVTAAVVHEPPVVRVLPDSKKWLRYFAGLYNTAYRFGVIIAMLRFVLVLGLHVLQAMSKVDIPDDGAVRRNDDDDFFMKQELIPVTNYMPDVRLIRQNGVKMFMAIGKWTLDKQKVYGRTVPILADMLGCEMVILPGHHVSYADTPDEWAAALRNVLHRATESEPTAADKVLTVS